MNALHIDEGQRAYVRDGFGAAITFRAWRVSPEGAGNPRHESIEIFLPGADTLADAERIATLNCDHKQGLLLLVINAAERPERRHLLRVYAIKRKTRGWRWDHSTGSHVPIAPLYPALVTQFCVHEGFAPVEPWRFTGDAVGRDMTLVEIDQ